MTGQQRNLSIPPGCTTDDFVEGIISVAASAMLRAGLRPHQLEQVAASIREFIRDQHGGELVYIRTCRAESVRRRNRQVLRDLAAGVDRREICRRHNISMRTLYRIQCDHKGACHDD